MVPNDFGGVFASRTPPGVALRDLGLEPAWQGDRLALGGAPVWAHPDGSVVVSGELVLDNHRELESELALPSVEPHRLVAELYRRDGPAAIRLLQGMFALAIWDSARGSVLLARDSLGARTLYYATDGSGWWFSARLHRLRRAPCVSGAISLTAMRNYLTYAYVPGSETLWRDVRELRPGTTMTLPRGQIDSFWEPNEGQWDPAEPITEQAMRLRAALEDAVRVRLPEVGPVGVLLSGGLDSSVVTALSARQAPGRVHTYSVHFGANLPNELAFSGLVATHCGTSHHVLELGSREMQASLADTMESLDDPIGDPLTVPNLLLARMASADVAVLLNGEGGDPCFGGPKNLPMLLHTLYSPRASQEQTYLRAYHKCYEDLPRLLSPDVRRQLENAEPQEKLLWPFLRDSGMSHYLNQLTHLNVSLKGADHILTKVNNLTTAAGVLGRSPFFDRRVVDMSFKIPPARKLDGAEEKAIVKHATADLLPEAILRRPKSGMRVPVQHWFGKELRPLAARMLLDSRSRTRPYLNAALVREWVSLSGDGRTRYGSKLWLLLSLEVWLRSHEA